MTVLLTLLSNNTMHKSHTDSLLHNSHILDMKESLVTSDPQHFYYRSCACYRYNMLAHNSMNIRKEQYRMIERSVVAVRHIYAAVSEIHMYIYIYIYIYTHIHIHVHIYICVNITYGHLEVHLRACRCVLMYEV